MFLPANAVCSVVQTAVIVGGLAPEKQRRLLRKRPDIIIATPGRLWELIQEVPWHSTLLFSVVRNFCFYINSLIIYVVDLMSCCLNILMKLQL